MFLYEGVLSGVLFREGGTLEDGRLYDAKLTLQFLEEVQTIKKIAGIEKPVKTVVKINFYKTLSDTQLLESVDYYNSLVGKKIRVRLLPNEKLNISFSDVELIK